MAQIDQPFRLQWSPDTTPGVLAAVDWTDLPGAAAASCERGSRKSVLDEYPPGKLSAKVNNGDNAGNAATHLLDQWRRWTPVRVVADIGAGDVPVWTGYVEKFEPDLDEYPSKGSVAIGAIDALASMARDKLSLESEDFPPDSEFGWAATAATLAATINADLIGASPSVYGDARVPVTLPAEKVTEENVERFRFRSGALEALQKALDVEIGSVQVTADGSGAVNGRYAVPDAYVDDGATPLFTLTNDAASLAADVWPFIRGSLKWTDPIADYHNGADMSGLTKRTFTAGSGLPNDHVEDLSQWCGSDRWVQANADLVSDLTSGIQQAWPAEVGVRLWDTAKSDFTLTGLVLDAIAILGRAAIRMRLVAAGSSVLVDYLCTVEGMRLTIAADHVDTVLTLGQAHARWVAAYDLSVGIFRLGGAGRGLGSGAILGP